MSGGGDGQASSLDDFRLGEVKELMAGDELDLGGR